MLDQNGHPFAYNRVHLEQMGEHSSYVITRTNEWLYVCNTKSEV